MRYVPTTRAVALDEDLRVVVLVVGELRVAERKADAEALRFVEERLRRGRRHLAFEERVDVGLVLEVPAGEEGRERELGIDDQLRAQPCATRSNVSIRSTT